MPEKDLPPMTKITFNKKTLFGGELTSSGVFLFNVVLLETLSVNSYCNNIHFVKKHVKTRMLSCLL